MKAWYFRFPVIRRHPDGGIIIRLERGKLTAWGIRLPGLLYMQWRDSNGWCWINRAS